jgi:hypothetical protein
MEEGTPPVWSPPGYVLRERVDGRRAETWRATSPTGATVAVTLLRSVDDVVAQCLRHDLALLAALPGEHLVRVHEVIERSPDLALVCDDTAGGSLAEILARRPQLAGPEIVTLVAPLAEALGELHEAGLVHGGVTADTILFTADGRPTLANPAVTRVLEPAPEGEVTPAADVFALCRIALEALSPDTAPVALGAALTTGVAGDPHERPGARALADAVLTACAAAPVGLVRRPPSRDMPAPARSTPVSPDAATRGAAPPATAMPAAPSDGQFREVRRPEFLSAVVDGLRGRVLGPAAVVVAVAVAVVLGLVWGRHSAVTPMTLPSTSPARTSPPAPPEAGATWTHTVAALTALRAQALTDHDAVLLDKVYAPGSPALRADTATVRSLSEKRLLVHGFAPRVLAARVLRVQADRTLLRVTETTPGYVFVDPTGRVAREVAAEAAHAFTMVLTGGPGSWRIVSISP